MRLYTSRVSLPVNAPFLRRQQTAQIKENEEKIKLNKALPYLVANVVELLDAPEEVRRVLGGRHCPRGLELHSKRQRLSTVSSPAPRVKDVEEAAAGGATDLDDVRRGKACVIKTTTRQVRLRGRAGRLIGEGRVGGGGSP